MEIQESTDKKLCECGCGQEVVSHNKQRYRRLAARFCFAHRKSKRTEFRKAGERPCACGCGEIVSGFTQENVLRIFVNGHNTRLRIAENHPLWHGGRMMHKGYVLVRCDGHPRASLHGSYVYEHILVMERHLNACVLPWTHIHHKNENRSDNRIENLLMTNQKEHMKIHAELRRKREG